MKQIKVFLIFGFLFYHFAYGQNNFIELYSKIDKKQEKSSYSMDSLRKKLNLTNDTFFKQTLQTKIDSLITVIDKLKEQHLLLDFTFIKDNPSSQKALELLSTKMWTQQAYKYCDTFFVLFNNLTTESKQSELGIRTQKTLMNFKTSRIGSQVPNFELTDVNGKIINLKSVLSNKYVLLDFWASWCGPCREDIPFLNQLVEKFSPNLNIIAISRDEDLTNWQKAINEENTYQWTHISTKQNEKENNILDNYFVWAIPVKILINRQGKIIGRWRGGGEENRRDLLKILTSELLQKE